MKFDINNYKGRYVMHCKTDEEAKVFCDYLHSKGKMWNINIPYKHHTNWNYHTVKTCYNFNEGFYDTIDHYIGVGYTILEFSDFNWSTEFTKADLKDGMVVELVNGNKYFILNNRILDDWGYLSLSEYNANLEYGDDKSHKYTIKKVYKVDAYDLDVLDDNYHTLIWERKEKPEPEEMTIEEICKALGKEIKIVKG